MKIILPNTNPYMSIFQIATHNSSKRGKQKNGNVYVANTQTSLQFANKSGGCGCRK